jgi:4-hydroxythreonine-4-phosphate dehydrogenase
MARQPQVLAVTPGDPEGIGPEVVWKSLQAAAKRRSSRGAPVGPHLLCIGARQPFEKLGAPIRELSLDSLRPRADRLVMPSSREPFVWLLPAPEQAPGRSFLPGYQSGWSIETAVRLVQSGLCQALVTGPISKERLRRGGYPYPGHTEFLAELCGVPQVTMMLANDALRVTLVTTHLALQAVSGALTRKEIEQTATQTIEALRSWWGLR